MIKVPGLNRRRRMLLRKLERIMKRVEKGRLPMYIKEVYLFGSFLRGKGDPSDLDILLIYDSNRTASQYTRVDEEGRPAWDLAEMQRSPSRLRGCLKSNSERTVDICICPSLEAFQKDLAYRMDIWLKIWGTEDRRWREKVRSHFQGSRPRPRC
ncbi:MAG: DUF6932 family protein [Methanomassiliicoccales archaeon]